MSFVRGKLGPIIGDGWFEGLASLEELSLENEGEQGISAIADDAFKGLDRLRILDLRGNWRLECLQRSLKTADACMTSAQPPISLFVEILDHYLAHLEAGNPLITPKYIAGLVALITEHVETMEAGEAREAVERHYANTRALIKARGVIELD